MGRSHRPGGRLTRTVPGRSGNYYSTTNNRPLVRAWERVPSKVRARWFSALRRKLTHIGVPMHIMDEFGPDHAMGLAVILDGCPPHTLDTPVHSWFLQLSVWANWTVQELGPDVVDPWVLRVWEV